jgi:hypothetical protein
MAEPSSCDWDHIACKGKNICFLAPHRMKSDSVDVGVTPRTFQSLSGLWQAARNNLRGPGTSCLGRGLCLSGWWGRPGSHAASLTHGGSGTSLNRTLETKAWVVSWAHGTLYMLSHGCWQKHVLSTHLLWRRHLVLGLVSPGLCHTHTLGLCWF